MKNTYTYKVIKNKGEGLKGYGYSLLVYKDKKLIKKERSFGGVSIAESYARTYFDLLQEYNGKLIAITLETYK